MYQVAVNAHSGAPAIDVFTHSSSSQERTRYLFTPPPPTRNNNSAAHRSLSASLLLGIWSGAVRVSLPAAAAQLASEFTLKKTKTNNDEKRIKNRPSCFQIDGVVQGKGRCMEWMHPLILHSALSIPNSSTIWRASDCFSIVEWVADRSHPVAAGHTLNFS